MFQVGGLWFGVGSVHMHFFSPLGVYCLEVL